MTFLCLQCRTAIPLASRESIQCRRCGERYSCDKGIWILQAPRSPDDFPPEAYALLAEAEPKHFWFKARNRLITATLKQFLGDIQGRSVLDVGCGTGFVAAELERAGMTACGTDMHIQGLRYARQRMRGPLFQCDSFPFSQQFDVVALCDVIEHMERDSALIRDAARALKKDGLMLITVPAAPFLWSAADEVSGHKRRYTRKSLISAMEQGGLAVPYARYFNILLAPALFLQRCGRMHTPASAKDALPLIKRILKSPPPWLNQLLEWACWLEMPLTRIPWPLGGSLIAIGQKS